MPTVEINGNCVNKPEIVSSVTSVTGLGQVCTPRRRDAGCHFDHGFIGRSREGGGRLRSSHQRIREAAMTMIYVVTAGRGDTYRIERIYLDSDEAFTFARDYNAMAPVETVQVEEWEPGAPPADYDGPYWRAQWWARVPIS